MVSAILRAVDEDVVALRELGERNPQSGFSDETPEDLKPQARITYPSQIKQAEDKKPYSTGE
jgi:hypothetical protein